MRYTLLFCTALAVSGGALAGEDSTHRWHGVGPAWYEVEGGLRRFAEGDPSESNPRIEEARERAERAASSGRPAACQCVDKDASNINSRRGNVATK
jgi:hypothetical protein